MKARVVVTLKPGVLDPQGKAIVGALKALGIEGVASVRQGKVFEVDVEVGDGAAMRPILEAAAERLLANPVIEDFDIEVSPLAAAEPIGVTPTGAGNAAQEEAATHAAMPAEGHP